MNVYFKKLIYGFLSAFFLFNLAASAHISPSPLTEYFSHKLEADRDFSLPQKLLASEDIILGSHEPDSLFESEEIRAEFAFSGLVLSWREFLPEKTNALLEVAFKYHTGWSDWQTVEYDRDSAGEEIDEEGYTFKDALLFADDAGSFRYRVRLEAADTAIGPEIRDLTFEYLRNESRGPVASENMLAALALPINEKGIIPRAQWGANEEFGYKSFWEKQKPKVDSETPPSSGNTKPLPVSEAVIVSRIENDPLNNESLIWPMEYPDRVRKIFIHHTATTKDLQRPMVAIRNIYHYHAVSKGWGDIGYNYLIDSSGNVYEGRRGGETVVGGHANGFNRGSVGIALLGDFEHEQPTYEMMAALIKLTKILTDRYGLDPEGLSSFNGTIMPNVSGHYEVAATRCPGGIATGMLPSVRKIAAKIGKNNFARPIAGAAKGPADYNFEIAEDYKPLYLEADSSTSLTIKLRNTGNKTWGGKTFLVADQNGGNRGSIEFLDIYTASLQHELFVRPGEIGSYTLQIKSGLKPDLLAFDLTLIFDGEIKTDNYISLPVYVNAPRMAFVQEKELKLPAIYRPGETAEIEYTVLNNGNVTWTKTGDSSVKLIFAEPLWHKSILMPGGELVAAELSTEQVKPGEVGRFKFKAVMPGKSGAIFEKLTLYNDTYGELEGQLTPLSFFVGDKNKPAAQLISLSPEAAFNQGETKIIEFKMRNTGAQNWKRIGQDALRVATIHNPEIKIAESFSFNEGEVKPDGIATFSLPLTAPGRAGDHVVGFVPWFQGIRLFERPIYFYFSVSGSEGEELANPEGKILSAGKQIVPKNQLSEQISGPKQVSPDKPLRVKITFNEPLARLKASSSYKITNQSGRILTAKVGDLVEISEEKISAAALSGAPAKFLVKRGEFQTLVEGPIKFEPESTQAGGDGNVGIVEVLNLEKRPAWNQSLNDNRFRGIMEIREFENKLVLINELPLEDYLKGIGEVSNGDPVEKIRALMVLARTYARYYRDLDQKFPGAPFHLDDNPDVSQKYLGYGLEQRSPNVVAAVAATSGKVVTYADRLVKTPYFNSSDGRTRSAEEVWGWTHTPYLQSVSDPLCKEGVLRGHGVGLSGCGATAAAQMGKNYEEIIKYYYQGVQIKEL